MDKIILKNIAFFGYHGVLQEEKTLGQRFYIDVEMYVDLRKASETDDVLETVDYGAVYKTVRLEAEDNRYDLIESLAGHIADSVLKTFCKVDEIIVTVRKPSAPVVGVLDYAAVEIRRKRD